ncbi:hypothetical protein QZH41_000137 [Actinostola sp. cb2023]|nr:hypothetical protein QZH41_000137 [Actinostola sp. cb2023]
MNSLLGVLVRFRNENVAATCDVEQMFHSFHVNPEHRDFLRFLWFRDNDSSKDIVEYRMVVHLFGSVSSPTVATYGMRKTADDGEEKFGKTAKEFVHNDFYVDDGLASRQTDDEMVDLIKNAQAMLATANLRLHKVVSNSIKVMDAIPASDRAKSVCNLDLNHDVLPPQRSLGVCWDLEKDTFTFSVTLQDKPFTRRGVLSVINSVYDPLGLAAPVILRGKLLLRQLTVMGNKDNENPLGWDDPLPDNLKQQWQSWRRELSELEDIQLPRCYHPKSFGQVVRNEIHAFSDASKDGIGVAIYLRQFDANGDTSVAFLLGQSRMTPLQATTIPRLELCAAVLSTQTVRKLCNESTLQIDDIIFYTDSKVVLGYIQNESRRFYVYVANRVQVIRSVSDPSQWRYIETSANPADLATREIKAEGLNDSAWLRGPEFLSQSQPVGPSTMTVDISESDPEVRKHLDNYATKVTKTQGLGSDRFKRFSKWSTIRRALANLIVYVKEFKKRYNAIPQDAPPTRQSHRRLPRLPTASELKQAETAILKTVQNESFTQEVTALMTDNLKNDEPEDTVSSHKKYKTILTDLDPFLDDDGVLRVGGRLRRSKLTYTEKHPAIIPKDHHVSQLLALHHHERVHHQGRQLTGGAIHQAGFWIIGCRRLVRKIIHSCVTCKKLRGKRLTQHMSDLPADRTDTHLPHSPMWGLMCSVHGLSRQRRREAEFSILNVGV